MSGDVDGLKTVLMHFWCEVFKDELSAEDVWEVIERWQARFRERLKAGARKSD